MYKPNWDVLAMALTIEAAYCIIKYKIKKFPVIFTRNQRQPAVYIAIRSTTTTVARQNQPMKITAND